MSLDEIFRQLTWRIAAPGLFLCPQFLAALTLNAHQQFLVISSSGDVQTQGYVSLAHLQTHLIRSHVVICYPSACRRG